MLALRNLGSPAASRDELNMRGGSQHGNHKNRLWVVILLPGVVNPTPKPAGRPQPIPELLHEWVGRKMSTLLHDA